SVAYNTRIPPPQGRGSKAAHRPMKRRTPCRFRRGVSEHPIRRTDCTVTLTLQRAGHVGSSDTFVMLADHLAQHLPGAGIIGLLQFAAEVFDDPAVDTAPFLLRQCPAENFPHLHGNEAVAGRES